MRLEQLLAKLGFSKNEARVYLAALECGTASAQGIAEKARVKRTTAYFVLAALAERGVIGKTNIRGRTRFVAEPPERLLALAEEVANGVRRALPELAAIHNRKDAKPKITFYEGPDAIQKVYDDTIRERPREILEWNTDLYFKKFPKDHPYLRDRLRAGIGAKRIGATGSPWERHRTNDKREMSETLIVPRDVFDPAIEVNIYNNKVAFMNYADEMSVIIESKAIADAMRQAYDLSWRGARTLSG